MTARLITWGKKGKLLHNYVSTFLSYEVEIAKNLNNIVGLTEFINQITNLEIAKLLANHAKLKL